jgi:hypothetical protein
MSSVYNGEINAAALSVVPYRATLATTLHQYPWHSPTILEPSAFVEWIIQHRNSENMGDVVEVRVECLFLNLLTDF